MNGNSGESGGGVLSFLRRDEPYYLLALVLVALTVAASYSPNANAWPLLVLTATCFTVPHLGRLLSVKASASGFELQLQETKAKVEAVRDEANELITTLRKSMIENSAVTLELVQRSGWWGGFEEDVKRTILESVDARLEEVGVPGDERERMFDRAWHRYNRQEYVNAILGGSHIPVLDRPRPQNAAVHIEDDATKFARQVHGEWGKFHARWPRDTVRPDELEKFLDEIGDDQPEIREFLSAYRYYCENKRHKDPELWARRHKVPHLKIKIIPQVIAPPELN